MTYDLFHRDGPGRFYRGNLHTHSTRSDGGMAPEAVCEAYRQQGYDFVAITDHYSAEFGFPITDTRGARREDFTTLIGAELHAPALANGHAWHILAIGLPFDFGPVQEDETGPSLARRAADAGAFVALAHPAFYGATIEDLESIPAAHAIEAVNEVCGRLNDTATSWYHVDQMLAAGRRITAIGADDAHFRGHSSNFSLSGVDLRRDPADLLTALRRSAVDPIANESGEEMPAGFSVWVWVRAGRLDPDCLVSALKAGDFYTSQGPVIHDIRLSEDRQHVKIVSSPVTSVLISGDPGRFAFAFRHGVQLTHCTFPISAYHGSFFRVTIIDAAGRRAWSNPIWLD